VFLLASFGVQRLWNYVVVDFPAVPEISFKRAVAIMALWGLVFVVVLTMISGARELMTPQAWEPKPNGWTHQLANDQTDEASEKAEFVDRITALVRLHERLSAFARMHSGDFPQSAKQLELEDEMWQVPGQFGIQFTYLNGRNLNEPLSVLAHEPIGLDEPILVLLVNGQVMEANKKQVDLLVQTTDRPDESARAN